MYSEKSSLGVTGGVALNLSPKAAFSTLSAVATTAASLTTALVPSVILISGAGAFAMAAVAAATSTMTKTMNSRSLAIAQQIQCAMHVGMTYSMLGSR